MSAPMENKRNWTSVHWGYGAGLAVCTRCWALVLPEDTRNHDDWHTHLDGQADD